MADFSEIEGRLVELGVMKKGDSFYSMLKLRANANSVEVANAMKPLLDMHNPRGSKNKHRKKAAGDITVQLIAAREALRNTEEKARYDAYRANIDTKSPPKKKALSDFVKNSGGKKTNAAQAILPSGGESSSAGQGQSTSSAPDPKDARIAELEAELARIKTAQATLAAEPAQLMPVVDDPNVVLDPTPIDYTDATKEECVAALRKWAIDPKGSCHHLVREKGRQPRGKPVEDVRDRIDYTNATKEQCVAALKKWGLDRDGVHHHTGELAPPAENQKRSRGQFAQEKCMFAKTEEVLNSVKSRLGNERKKWEKGDEKMQAFLVADKVKLKFTPCTELGERIFIVYQSAGRIREGKETLEEQQKARDGQELIGMLAAAASQGPKKKAAKKK